MNKHELVDSKKGKRELHHMRMRNKTIYAPSSMKNNSCLYEDPKEITYGIIWDNDTGDAQYTDSCILYEPMTVKMNFLEDLEIDNGSWDEAKFFKEFLGMRYCTLCDNKSDGKIAGVERYYDLYELTEYIHSEESDNKILCMKFNPIWIYVSTNEKIGDKTYTVMKLSNYDRSKDGFKKIPGDINIGSEKIYVLSKYNQSFVVRNYACNLLEVVELLLTQKNPSCNWIL